MAGQDPGTRKGEGRVDPSPTGTAEPGGWKVVGTAWPRLEKWVPIKLLCAPLAVPLPQSQGWQLVALTWLAPGSSNASPFYPAGNIPQLHTVPLTGGSRGKAVPGSKTELLSWAQTHPSAAPVLHMFHQAGAQGWRGRSPLPAVSRALLALCAPDPQPWSLSHSAAPHHPWKHPGLSPCCYLGWVQLPEPQAGAEMRLTYAVGQGSPSSLPAPSTSTARNADIRKGHPTKAWLLGGTPHPASSPLPKGPPFSSAQPHPHQGTCLSPQPSPTLREAPVPSAQQCHSIRRAPSPKWPSVPT